MSTTCLEFPREWPLQPPLDEISTRWTQVKDPAQFVLRYSQAIRAYLLALLKDEHAADDVSQDFVLHFLQRGLTAADPDRGRFPRLPEGRRPPRGPGSPAKGRPPARQSSAARRHA